MHSDEFNKIVNQKLQQIQDILVKKTNEYNLDEDRLSVFKSAAILQKETSAEALLGMLTKHIISIYDMVKSCKPYPIEKWDEKCIDAINYFLLLLAIETEVNENRHQ